MNSVTTHGQELSSEFLDDLLLSILTKIPVRQWVEIKKNHDQVIAGIKHIIDNDCFGENIEIVLNDSYTHFKKRDIQPPHVKIFEGKYLSNHPESFWKEQDALRIKQEMEIVDKEKRKEERELNRKRHGKRR